ncbi:MAG: erythromycin esterase family protein, partial [Cyclobacteriaceae bacterium]
DENNVVLVGFGSYKGSVIAGDHWEAPMQKMPVPPARDDSWEALLHKIEEQDLLIIFEKQSEQPKKNIGHRAIGVVYDPHQEQYTNYVPSLMPYRYDASIQIDQSQALHPLKIKPDGNKTPETYPFNV